MQLVQGQHRQDEIASTHLYVAEYLDSFAYTFSTFMTDPAEKIPHWPAIVAIVADAALYLGLPDSLSVGPRWLLLAIVLFLLIPITIAHYRKHMPLVRILTLIANGVITVSMIASIAFLIQGLPKHREQPEALLRSAVGLWLTNILVFALWYWRLDAGGPHERERSKGKLNSAFLFPQMLQRDQDTYDVAAHKKKKQPWTPEFVDYLFLAFNTSTAFSPTDTAVLSRGAKLGMIAQSLISLAILVLIAARAVNIL
ncbi:MAG TPA: hypothetical protein VIM00_13765 [Candidatus Acidoferrum sp.]|jgi:hypothetical protein